MLYKQYNIQYDIIKHEPYHYNVGRDIFNYLNYYIKLWIILVLFRSPYVTLYSRTNGGPIRTDVYVYASKPKTHLILYKPHFFL